MDLDAQDAADYAAGRVGLDEFVRRVLARQRPSVGHHGGIDPVAIYDAMREAGTSLMGSYVWLADHAETEAEADRWRAAYAAVHAERHQVDARDQESQLEATTGYVELEQAVRSLVQA